MNFKNLFKSLYFWVLFSILAGIFLGLRSPEQALCLKPVADAFISLIRMVIGPIIFCTVVLGISGAGDIKKAGKVGAKALLYFEVVSTFALAIGLLVVNCLKPGKDFNADPKMLDLQSVSEYAVSAGSQNVTGSLLHLIPKTFMDAFSGSGDLIQILFLAILFGCALNALGEKGKPLHLLLEALSQVFFKIIHYLMKLAPLGAGSAIAYTVGKFGVHSLSPLISLMGCFYLACLVFIIGVLGPIAAMAGLNIFKFITFIKTELFTVLGTSSSESVLVPLMEKLEFLGCGRSIVRMVIPAGYSFNLDGTNIYLTMATLFIAQALNIHLSIGQQMSILGVALLTSKGASGVTGAGFITLAATLQVVPEIPVAGLALILGIDRFMSEARALTNVVGNGVATVVISKWENQLNLNPTFNKNHRASAKKAHE